MILPGVFDTVNDACFHRITGGKNHDGRFVSVIGQQPPCSGSHDQHQVNVFCLLQALFHCLPSSWKIQGIVGILHEGNIGGGVAGFQPFPENPAVFLPGNVGNGLHGNVDPPGFLQPRDEAVKGGGKIEIGVCFSIADASGFSLKSGWGISTEAVGSFNAIGSSGSTGSTDFFCAGVTAN